MAGQQLGIGQASLRPGRWRGDGDHNGSPADEDETGETTMGVRKKSIEIATAAAVALAAAGCGGAISGDSGAGSDDVLTIGLLIPETGPYAPLGKEMKRSADLFLAEHDHEIDGQQVELVVADSAGDPETGKSKAKELALKEKVDVITGVVSSPVAVTVAEEAEANEVPVVIANAGADELTGEDASEFVWRVSQSNYQHGYAAGAYAAEHVSRTGAVFMGSDYSAGTETRDGFVDGYQDNGGGELEAEILTPFGKTQNYQPFLSRIPEDAEFVYGFYAGGEAITFEKNYAEFGYDEKLPLLGAQNLTDEDILPALGDAGEGVVTVGIYAPALENDANAAFIEAWDAEYDATPSIIAVTTYDAFTFISEAAAKAEGDATPASLTEAFPSVGPMTSPRGEFLVDPDTHNPVQDYYARELVGDGSGYVNEVVATIPSVTG
jgi:branched-chain amino acid transport system substrate-binding protein